MSSLEQPAPLYRASLAIPDVWTTRLVLDQPTPKADLMDAFHAMVSFSRNSEQGFSGFIEEPLYEGEDLRGAVVLARDPSSKLSPEVITPERCEEMAEAIGTLLGAQRDESYGIAPGTFQIIGGRQVGYNETAHTYPLEAVTDGLDSTSGIELVGGDGDLFSARWRENPNWRTYEEKGYDAHGPVGSLDQMFSVLKTMGQERAVAALNNEATGPETIVYDMVK
jgi:hypothetical protein